MTMRLAITRGVSPALARGELTHLARQPIDLDLAREQHGGYEALLASLGCTIVRLPAEPDLPDSVFVEDAAVVLDEIAVLARPGAASRREEVDSIARALAPHRTLARIEGPATLDGGDVLRMGRTLYVGLSTRTNERAAQQLRGIVGPFGYRVETVPIARCLHLKSAVSQVAAETVLLNPAWVDPRSFGRAERIEIDPSEPFAANALRVGDSIIFPEASPQTRRRLEEHALRVATVDVTELAKAEGGVTCCTLLLESPETARNS